MKYHRFIGDFNLFLSEITITNTEIVHQIRRVLKLHIGEYIILSDVKGKEAKCLIGQVEKNSIKVRVKEVYRTTTELDTTLILFCSLLKKEHFEWMIEKAVELGVAQIVPLNCERTIRNSFNKNRLHKIIKESSEQSGRGKLPELFPGEDFKRAISEPRQTIKILFDSSGSNYKILESKLEEKSSLALELYIGPEGGWTEKELALALENNVEVVSLGKTTLRAETAVLAALCWARFLNTTH